MATRHNRQWSNRFFLSVLIFFILLGIINYIIDPSQQYRKATIYKIWYGGGSVNERFINAGFAKNYDYDSIAIGSSMVENFLIKDLQRLMPNPIKLCMSGGTTYEIKITLNTAFKYQKIKKVLLGLDLYALKGNINRENKNVKFPLYLYDNNPINDMNYLFTLDTFKKSWEVITEVKKGKESLLYDYNHMNEWQYRHNDNEFNKEKVLEIWKKKEKYLIQEDWKFNKLRKSFDVNILSIVKEHPETKFYIFYPPYSILVYSEWKVQGVFEDVVKIKKYVYDTLVKYPNVELYDFQVAQEITTNLDYYRDSQHYHQKINSWIIDQMIDEKFQVNKNKIGKSIFGSL